MKKLSEKCKNIIIWVVLVVVMITIGVVFADKTTATIEKAAIFIFLGLMTAFVGLYSFELQQIEKHKNSMKQLILHIAVICIIGVILIIAIIIKQFVGEADSIMVRLYGQMLNYVMIYYVIVLVEAIATLIKVLKNNFGAKYDYEKGKYTLQKNGKYEEIEVKIFTKTSWDKKIINVTIDADVDGKAISIKGKTREEAEQRFLEKVGHY